MSISKKLPILILSLVVLGSVSAHAENPETFSENDLRLGRYQIAYKDGAEEQNTVCQFLTGKDDAKAVSSSHALVQGPEDPGHPGELLEFKYMEPYIGISGPGGMRTSYATKVQILTSLTCQSS